jgi:two-component system response regulator NreC
MDAPTHAATNPRDCGRLGSGGEGAPCVRPPRERAPPPRSRQRRSASAPGLRTRAVDVGAEEERDRDRRDRDQKRIQPGDDAEEEGLHQRRNRAVLERDASCSVIGEAANGREAVRLARTLKPDVVVMDVAMSDLNGIEATRQIRNEAPNVRIVALSSHSDRRYVKAILGAGASGYVLKANAYDDLRRAVEAAAQGKKYLCADVTDQVIAGALSDRPEASAYEVLAPRELEVLQLLTEGLTSSQIAARLFVATSTVETHRRNIMRKLNLHSVAELTKYAVREGVTTLDAGSPRRES